MDENLSKYVKSESVEVNRSELSLADYNPRILSDEARKSLKRGIKKFGLVGVEMLYIFSQLNENKK